MVSGFINLLKPPGPTSHDMVAFVRRLLGVKRVGHTGTLDPLAVGVLVVAVGRATRLISYLEDTKTYRGEITFGKTTSTLDAGGEITSVCPASFHRQELNNVLPKFTGPILQTPPMVSAIKWRGRRLYEMARQGLEIERKPRSVAIHQLTMLSFTPDSSYPRALIECTCSPGTYIRSLAADIGDALGFGAYLSFLLRTQSGVFTIANSLTPVELEEAVANKEVGNWLLPPEKGVQHLPDITLCVHDTTLFIHGNIVLLQSPTGLSLNSTVCVYSYDGSFLGLGKLNPSSQGVNLKPTVVFN